MPAYNFNAGPAVLPRTALEYAQREFLDFQGTGMSVLEISHRSKDFEAVIAEAEALAKELLAIPDGYKVLFLQGGASLQFAMVPMNILGPGESADYVLTGSWSEKAFQEAEKVASVRVAASTKEGGYKRIPDVSEIQLGSNPAYVHITTNNTIYGAQWRALPAFPGIPIVADMSSDMLSRPVNVADYGIIYAGLQKNAGPAGATMVIIREDWLAKSPKTLPTMLRYDVMAKNSSLYNTPPVFSIYMSMLVMRWLKELGGLEAIARRNEAKAKLIYDAIDNSDGFYTGHAEPGSRSLMNITFNLGSEEQEKAFLAKAKDAGFVGLAGHRSVGGVRASTYNACPVEACEALVQFMQDYRCS
ncbi:MAG TPA: 3-phosphoserine/phosphohydroxythreonine transaminase [Armatimonadota bacterium]|jgi:phosphoserine aminotransferase